MLLHLSHTSTSSGTVDFTGEADHRIANHLTMVNGICRIQANALRRRKEPLSGAEAGAIIDGIGAKVEAISLLHRRLARSEADASLPLGEYLRELITGITEALADENYVEFQLLGDADCVVSARQTVTIGLIVCELVTNAMKHAHPSGVAGHLWVRCGGGDGPVIVEVEDDGVGLPDGFNPKTATGLGFNTMRALAAQLGATLSHRNTGLGLVAELRVPVVANQ